MQNNLCYHRPHEKEKKLKKKDSFIHIDPHGNVFEMKEVSTYNENLPKAGIVVRKINFTIIKESGELSFSGTIMPGTTVIFHNTGHIKRSIFYNAVKFDCVDVIDLLKYKLDDKNLNFRQANVYFYTNSRVEIIVSNSTFNYQKYMDASGSFTFSNSPKNMISFYRPSRKPERFNPWLVKTVAFPS